MRTAYRASFQHILKKVTVWLDYKLVTNAKSSPKMVEPGDTAGNAEEEEKRRAVLSSGRDRPAGLVVKASASGAEDPIRGSNPARAVGIFPRRVIPVTSKLTLQWLPCQAPGVIGAVPGLVSPVSVRDWVRWKV